MIDTAVLPAHEPGAIARAVEVLGKGGLVGFPTDTVYGVGAAAFMGAAIRKLYQAKERSRHKSIPVLIADQHDLHQVAARIPEAATRLAARFWPGPLTMVLPRAARLPAEIGPGDTVGVRVPDHPVALELLRAAGPLAVSSANLSGHPSVRTADAVERALAGRIDLILDGGETPGGVPSTVVDGMVRPPAVLRAGPISRFRILQALGS